MDVRNANKFGTILRPYYPLCWAFDVIRRNVPTLGSIFLFVCLTLHLALGLPGCQSAPPPPAEVQPEPEPKPEPPPLDNRVLFPRLDAAEQAIADNHLTYPEEGSAYSIYLEILKTYPNQEDAIRGIERIVEAYVALSMRALERRQFAAARSMLARARLIEPGHPSIAPSAAQLRLIEEADRETLSFKQADVRSKAATLVAQLRNLAQTADGRTCRFIISARSDGQGRWIYQQLSEGLNRQRLRAQIKIRTPAGVERLCFAGSTQG